jgi:3-isopropylmalate/(R)-2-methylmalate dehydratase small subunit
MKKFDRLTAIAAPLEVAKVDTGMILPGRYMRQHRRPGHDYAEAFLHDLRFDEHEQRRPAFSLNQPEYQHARIIVTDIDFGCGSSREGAAYAVLDFGVLALIGSSFGDIFFANCLQNGILPVVLPQTVIQELWSQIKAAPGCLLTIDLPHQIVIAPDGSEYGFEVNALRKQRLMDGTDDIDVTIAHLELISAYEARRHAKRPWLPTASRDDPETA